MQPLISVCIPTFNNAEYIVETLQSVLAQTYSHIEIIVTDDGSVDNTVELVRETLGDSDIPHRVEVMEENQGIGANWNRALSLCTGKYVKLLPGDDVLAPDCLSRQAHDLQSAGDKVAISFCARKIITASGKHLLTARFFPDGLVNAKALIEKCVTSGTNVLGEPGAVLFRRSASQQVGQFDDTRPYVIDLNYWARLLQLGDAVAIEDTLASFRIDKNLSVRIGWHRCVQFRQFIDQSAAVWGISKLPRFRGHMRAIVNEILRRVVHIVFRLVA